MSFIKAVPLSQLSKYSAADDQIVLMSSTDEQPADAAEMTSALGLGTAATAALLDSDTMTGATASNVPSAESVKAYVDASGGTVDNAAVNTAILTDPDATQNALGTFKHGNLGLFASGFRGTNKNLTIVRFGDSLVNDPILNLSSTFPRAGGYARSEDSIDGGAGVASQVSSAGGSPADDWTYPGGRQVTLPSGSSRIFGFYNVTAATQPFRQSSRFRIWYVVGPGTLRVQASAGVSSTFTNVTTANSPQEADATADFSAYNTASVGSTGDLQYLTINFIYSDFRRIKLFSDSGTIKIVGIEAYEDNSSGRGQYREINLGLGGSFSTSWDDTTQTNWNTMLSVMNPSVIVFKAATFHVTTGGTEWRTALDRIRAAAPNAMLLLVGTHPWIDEPDPENDPTGWDAALKAYAATYAPQTVFADVRRYFPSYAKMADFVAMSVSSGTDLFTSATHGFQTGETVSVTNSGGALPSPLAAATTYYVIRISADTFKLATTYANALAGTAIDITTSGTGTNRIVTGGNLISGSDGIHLSSDYGMGYLSALVGVYAPTLTTSPQVDLDLNTKINASLYDTTGVVRSGYINGPLWSVYGDLQNANGYIGFGSSRGSAANMAEGPHYTAFSTLSSNAKVANGYALGVSKTSHQLLWSTRLNGRMMISDIGNAETALTRDIEGQLEVFPVGGASKPGLVISVATGQTGDMMEFRTGSLFTASGTKKGGINLEGIYYHTPVAHTATTAAIPLTSQTNALTTTLPAQAITLADGIPGQVKTIMHVATSGGGTAVLTPATKTGYTTITFTNVGDTVTLKFYATYGWMIESIRGAVAA